MKTCKRITLLQDNGRKERQDDYPTCISACRCRVVFLSFPPLLCNRIVFLHILISALFLYFLQVHPYFKSSIAETSFPLSLLRCIEWTRNNEVLYIYLSKHLDAKKRSNRHRNFYRNFLPYFLLFFGVNVSEGVGIIIILYEIPRMF